MSERTADPQPGQPRNYDRELATGALVNVLGSIGKAMVPLYFILITRLYGPDVIGVFYLAFTVLQVATSLSVSGLNDGVVMFVSRNIEDKEKENRIYNLLANGFAFSLLIALLLIVAAFAGGLDLVARKYPQPGVADSLRVLVWALPFTFIPILVSSATKTLLIMKWDALLIGFLQPLLQLVCAIAFYLADPSLESLLWSYLTASIMVAMVALYIFSMYFSYRRLLSHLLHFKAYLPLVYFAAPQNINLTFTTFVSNLDVLMLGYFKFSPDLIAFYGMGSQVVRSLRQVKLAFSSIYGPVIARLHAQGRIAEINDSFSTLSRWTSVIGFPVALVIIIFRDELLWLFHPSFATSDTSFMYLLLVVPLISITIGFCANILVMTGHSVWNLVNSLSVTGINLTMSYLCIPHWGLLGAALATATSQLLVTLGILAQIRILTGARLIIVKVYKPYLAISMAAAAWFVIAAAGGDGVIVKIVGALAGLTLYGVTLRTLGFEAEDRNLLSKLRLRRTQPAETTAAAFASSEETTACACEGVPPAGNDEGSGKS